MASENRKKVQLYIYPEQKPQDRLTAQHYDNMPAGLRSQAYRNALVAGAALARIDPRLPEILAVSLSTDPAGDELKTILRGFIGIDTADKGYAPASVKPESPTEPPCDTEQRPLNSHELNELGNNFAV